MWNATITTSHTFLLGGALQHAVLGILGRGLGDAEMAELAPRLLFQQCRRDYLACLLVCLRHYTVQLEDIDIVGAEAAQRVVKARNGALGGAPTLATRNPGLGGDQDIIARDMLDRLADDLFGAIGRGGVEQIDAHVQRLADEGDGLGRALAGAEPEPAEPATAETGDADPELGAAECDIFHDPLL